MARTTLPQQPEQESQSHTSTQTEVENQIQASSASSTSSSRIILVIVLVMKLLTLACLIVSISLLASNSVTIEGYSFHFNDFYSYRYALSTGVIGLAYTLSQLSFSIHQVMTSGKLHHNHAKLLLADFYGDKVVLGLLGTGVGAVFGATVDLKSNLDSLEDGLEEYPVEATTLSPVIAKLDDFFNRAYFPAIFLLIAFLTCGLSSVFSSLALLNRTHPQTR